MAAPKDSLPSDEQLAKIVVKYFGPIKQHFKECPMFRNFINEAAEDDAEDMFEDEEEMAIYGDDSDNDEAEDQVSSEDEDIEFDSDDEDVKKLGKVYLCLPIP